LSCPNPNCNKKIRNHTGLEAIHCKAKTGGGPLLIDQELALVEKQRIYKNKRLFKLPYEQKTLSTDFTNSD